MSSKHCTLRFIGKAIYFVEQCFWFVWFFKITLPLCSRLANNKLEKEKEELIHQTEIHKHQGGAESTLHGNVFYSILTVCYKYTYTYV